MPCNCDHLKATNREVELSKIACLLDELVGESFDKSSWEGYHPLVYVKAFDGDKAIEKLCTILQELDVTDYSLEMQMWWRDHQEIDKLREEKEEEEKVDEDDRKVALNKLTKKEKKLLSLI